MTEPGLRTTTEPDATDATEGATDDQLVTRVVGGQMGAFAALMRRYNRRLFRVVRGMVHADADAEDVCQEAWLRAYEHLDALREGATFPTWLARIGLRCAIARAQQVRGLVSVEPLESVQGDGNGGERGREIDRERLAREIERAIDGLTPSYRAVVLMRDVEHMSTNEVAQALELSEQNVRVRLHRARASLRERMVGTRGPDFEDVFRFDDERCARITRLVMGRLDDPRDSDPRYATRSVASASDSPSPSTMS